MKTKTSIRLFSSLIYIGFVGGLLALSQCESSPKITTPEADVQLIAQKASIIRTEVDLRNIEKMAYEYELAYRHSYGGAKALYFKQLVEPIIVAAGDRRDSIRNVEDALRAEQLKFHKRLSDIDEAWRMKITTPERDLERMATNDARIATIQHYIDSLQLEKEALGECAWDGPGGSLDKNCLEKIGKIETIIEKQTADIATIGHKNYIISLAYRLQRNEELTLPAEEVVVEEGIIEE